MPQSFADKIKNDKLNFIIELVNNYRKFLAKTKTEMAL